MRMPLSTVILLFYCICFSVTTSAEAPPVCHLKMAWNDDRPFTFLNDANQLVGTDIDIATLALKRLGCTLEFIKMPWARSLYDAKQGRIDIISGAFDTAERRHFLNYSQFGFFSPNIAFARKEDIASQQISSLDELLDYGPQVGVQIDVSYGERFDQIKNTPRFTQRLIKVSHRKSLWRMLALKRVDLVFADRVTGQLELKDLGLQNQIVPTRLVLSSRPAFFAFAKATISPQWIKLFDQELKKMDQAGELKAIEAVYIGP